MYHVLVSDGITFLAMAEEAVGRRLPFAFLDDVSGRFLAAHGAAAREVGSGGGREVLWTQAWSLKQWPGGGWRSPEPAALTLPPSIPPGRRL
jgi:hypothetical protein